MIFKNPNKNIEVENFRIKLSDTLLTIHENTKFLGIFLDQHLCFTTHIQHLVRQLNYVSLMFKHVRRYFNEKTMLGLYYTFFYPFLIYGIEFWGHASKTELNKVLILQKQVLRIILNIKAEDSITPSFKKYKIMPVNMLFKFRLLLHFLKTFTREKLRGMSVDHDYGTGYRDIAYLKTSRFRTNKGQRSMFYTAVLLYNQYLNDCEGISLDIIRVRLAERLWEGDWEN